MKKILVVFLIISLISGTFPISAAANTEALSNGSGYIVKLKTDSVGTGSLSETEKARHGLVYAASQAELEDMIAGGNVLYYEPNYSAEILGTVNDPYFVKQWNLRDIKADAAWDAGMLGAGARVAVIDSGINAQHEDFVGINILNGENVIDGSDNTNDELGHGTFVTGIIAAARNNRVGIAGIADQVTIVPIKCFADSDNASIFDICRGIYAAVDDYDCDVICMSLGTPEDSKTLKEAVDYAAENDVIVVAAVGNEGSTELYYPAAYDSVIGTASYGASGEYSGFSQENKSVFVSAPGANISSTYIGSAGSYATADGTSFSAPHIAALAAIAKASDPGLTVEEFKELLIESSTDAGDPGYDVVYGCGKANFKSFIAALQILEAEPSISFSDTDGHWAEDAIAYCVRKGLFTGISDSLFDPDGGMTRAMLVTVLYRYDNGALTAGSAESGFSDVADPSAWYYDAVCWASSNNIVTGYQDGTFRPDALITREQLAAVLYRYVGSPAQEDSGVLGVFSDYGDISDYALSAFTWSYKAGIIGGTGNAMLSPAGNATRAQVAVVMKRYAFI